MEEDETFEEDTDTKEENTLTDEEDEDEAFTKGYSEDDEAEECAECGITLRHKKKVTKPIEGEEYVFCSDDCAKEFEESLAKTEE
ncbi:MAG: hypothetical protein Q7K45_00485 [Nanoarchaeota archaeon]|nr:hypothetical protein [Nanoarchaeota archaeon]